MHKIVEYKYFIDLHTNAFWHERIFMVTNSENKEINILKKTDYFVKNFRKEKNVVQF